MNKIQFGRGAAVAVLLMAPMVGSAQADAWDPGDGVVSGATQLTSPTVNWKVHGPHTLLSPDDADWFRVYLTAGLQFTAESATNSGDLVGELYVGTTASTLVASDDDSAGNLNFRITYTSAASGWYTLRVARYGRVRSAAYTLLYRAQLGVAPPELALSQTLLQQRVDAGSTAAAQTFTVRNAGGGTLSYSVASSASWLRVSPSSGTSAGEYDTLTVYYYTDGLRPGRYVTNLTVTAPGATLASAAVRVELDVISLEDRWDPVDNVPAGATQLAAPYAAWQVHGPHTLSAFDDYDWYRVFLNAGQMFTVESASNSSTLLVGMLYTGTAGTTLVASNSYGAADRNFRISYAPTIGGWHTLRVSKGMAYRNNAAYVLQYRTQSAVSAPALAVSHTLLQRSVVAGGVAPAQSFTVRNAGGGTLSYAVVASSGWLRVSPASGTSTGEYDTLNVLYDTAALAPGRYTAYLTVSSAGVAGSPAAVRVELDVQAGPRPGSLLDYDGDGLTDLSLFHPASACWDIYRSTTRTVGGFYQGRADSIPLLADFDGDGRVDHATYTAASGLWQIRQSRSGASLSIQFGWSAALPVPADYDGDGQADLAVYYPATGAWYIRQSASNNNMRVASWGYATAVPVPGDYDGDGRTDLAVMDRSNARWYVSLSGTPGASIVRTFGSTGATPVPADYTGDGKTDFAVYHRATGNWYIERPGVPVVAENWGWSAAYAIPADYDGDGRVDQAVFHPAAGDWFIRNSSSPTPRVTRFGSADRKPGVVQFQINQWMGVN